MALASTASVVVWFVVLAGAGWVLVAGLLHQPRRHREWAEDRYCGYCGWGLSRTAGYEVYRWRGSMFCSLVCPRRDEAPREKERG